jgi:hypothetical protein
MPVWKVQASLTFLQEWDKLHEVKIRGEGERGVFTIPGAVHLAIRIALAALWLDEGLYLKVVARNPHELRIVPSAAQVFHLSGLWVMVLIGLLETAIAVLLLLNVWAKKLALGQLVLLLGMNLAGVLLGGGEISDPIYLMVHNLPTFACLFVLMTCEPGSSG